jgi:hypothetical protein
MTVAPEHDATHLSALWEPDERTLRFLPNGLGVGLAMFPADSAEFWHSVAAECVLPANVAEGTRRSFQDLKKVFTYGVLCYELFTLVHDHALLVFEQALRDRFLQHYPQGATFRVGTEYTVVPAGRYDDVTSYLESRRPRRAELVLDEVDPTSTISFNGNLSGLRAWARAVGLLDGQRARHAEDAIAGHRNGVAHPNDYHLVTPVSAARMLRDLTEIINRLWGHRTEGGRMYPAPAQREPIMLAWNPVSGDFACSQAAAIHNDDWSEYSSFAVVQGVWDAAGLGDPRLSEFDSRYETTPYPVDVLHGPSPHSDAIRFIANTDHKTDYVDLCDRMFAVRVDNSKISMPIRPSALAGAPSGQRSGHWLLLMADNPIHAVTHAKHSLALGAQPVNGPCNLCPAHTVAHGKRHTIMSVLGTADDVQRPKDFHMPSAPARHIDLEI